MEEAEDVIYPNDYSIDKMVFKLTRETDDKDVRSIDDQEKIMEFITNIDDEVKLSNEKYVLSQLSE